MYKEGRDCVKHDSWYIKQGLLIPDPTLVQSKSRATLAMLLQSRAYPHPNTGTCNMKHTGLQSLRYNRGTGAQHFVEVFALALGSMLLQRHKQWVYRGEKEDKGAADLHLHCAESNRPILITGSAVSTSSSSNHQHCIIQLWNKSRTALIVMCHGFSMSYVLWEIKVQTYFYTSSKFRKRSVWSYRNKK